MRRNCLLTLMALTGFVQGCGPIPVYTTAEKPSDKAGIGFFPIIAMDQSKRIYEQTWYELTVTRTLLPPGSKDDKAAYEQRLVRYTTDPVVAGRVYRAFSEKEKPEDAWAQIKDAFVEKKVVAGGVGWGTPSGAVTGTAKKTTTPPPHNPPGTTPTGVEAKAPSPPAAPAPSGGLPLLDERPPDPFDLVTPQSGQDLATLISRQGDKPAKLFLASIEHTQLQAPGRKIQYLNIQTPHGGTAQGSIQINQDGTLANASGQIQDTMPGKWVDAFSAITSAGLNAIGSVFKAAGENRPGEKAAQLDVKRVSRTYTIIIQRPIEESEAKCGGLEKMLQGAGDAACHASLVVAMAADQSSDDKGKKKDKADAKDTKEKKDADK